MDDEGLILDIALALREIRLYWQRGRDPLTLDDKRELARRVLAHLRASSVTWTVTRGDPTPKGRGTGEFMR